MRLGLRPMPGHDPHDLDCQLRTTFTRGSSTAAKEAGASIELSVIQAAAPCTPSTNLARTVYSSKLSRDAVSWSSFCHDDGGCLAEMGTSPLIWGPGNIDVAHQPNEYVKIDELNQYEHALESILHSWCL